MSKDLLISWKYSLAIDDIRDFFLGQVRKLFTEASLYESVNAPKERKWAFLIYTFDSEDVRPYPSESDYAATCKVYINANEGHAPIFIDLKTLDLYGPLKTYYEELGDDAKWSIVNRTMTQIANDF